MSPHDNRLRRCRTVDTFVLQVGEAPITIYGCAELGWSVDCEDFLNPERAHYRYDSIEELFFALVNLSLGGEGSA